MKPDHNKHPAPAPTGSVAIIGAGWAGLSAAVTLARAGKAVTVFEASRHLGGRARSVRFNEGSGDDIALDNGQHVLIGAYKETLRIMRAVGAAPGHKLERIPLELRFADGFHLRAPVLPYPFNLGVALFAAYGMNPRRSLSAVRFMRALQALRFRIEPDRTVASLLQEHTQDDVLCTHLWEPLCVSALNTPPSRASAQVFATVLRDGLTGARHHSDLLIPRVDLGSVFPEPAAHYLQGNGAKLHLGTPVRRIERVAEGFRLDHRPETYSQVVVAVAPQHASALLAPLEAACPELSAERSRIDRLDYEPIVTCYLQYAPGVTIFRPMLGMTEGIVQWVFDRGHLLTPDPYRKPETPLSGLMAAVISASGEHEDMDNDALAAKVHEELLPLLMAPPPVGMKPLWTRVIREKRATFSCVPSLERPAGVTPLRGLLLAGDYVAGEYPGTIEAAVRSGIAAAGAILRP
jgi:squalene-associated FAD-dependent desaturase